MSSTFALALPTPWHSLRNTRPLYKKESYVQLLQQMSPTLRGDITLHISARTLNAVWYFHDCEPSLLRTLSEHIRHAGYAPREKIPWDKRLVILSKGAAVKNGKVMLIGDYWGEGARPGLELFHTR